MYIDKDDNSRKVAIVIIHVEDHCGTYDYPQLMIYDHYRSDDSQANFIIKFQRNTLDDAAGIPCDTRYVAKSQVGLWSEAYSPRMDEFKICRYGIEDLLKLVKKIDKAIEVYNIRHVTNDELMQWYLALEKLRYETIIEFWKDGKKVNRHEV